MNIRFKNIISVLFLFSFTLGIITKCDAAGLIQITCHTESSCEDESVPVKENKKDNAHHASNSRKDCNSCAHSTAGVPSEEMQSLVNLQPDIYSSRLHDLYTFFSCSVIYHPPKV